MALSPAQVRDIARKTAEDRRRKAAQAAAPSPQEDKDNQRTAHRVMRRRVAKQRGYL